MDKNLEKERMNKMTEVQIIETKDIREKCIENIEVLNKVKKLFLIPEMEVMTTKMVADYYEVPVETIKKCYQYNISEINSDGVILYKSSIDFLTGQNSPTRIKNENGRKIVEYKELTIIIPNCNIKVFPQRAILRIGMLLRDSSVAKEIRTQLLNTFENSTVEQRIETINEEMILQANVGKAYMGGNIDEFAKASMEYNTFKNRYTIKLENENVKLAEINKDLETVNSLLVRKTLEWGYKPILNALMRKYALACFSKDTYKFADAWTALYRHVKYKFGWDIANRKTAKKMIDRITEYEFQDVIAVAVSLLESNKIDVSKVINDINAENVKN